MLSLNHFRVNMKLSFIFSSITYLQYYIPIVIEAQKSNIQAVFYLRKNWKDSVNPLSRENLTILYPIIKKYGIKIQIQYNPKTIQGNVIMVDGDIYGPTETSRKESLLFQLNHKQTYIISLQENINYKWSYQYYKDLVDKIIFPNKQYANEYNLNSSNNLYLGTPKYDYIMDTPNIYKKYNLSPKKKYVLFFAPKKKFVLSYNIKPSYIINLYNIVRSLGFTIITKTRPKDSIPTFPGLRGDIYIESDCYPNQSLELLKISDLAIFFSSSAIEETIMMEVPSINCRVDNDLLRLQFLYHPSCVQTCSDWETITPKRFSELYIQLDKKGSNCFEKMKTRYLFESGNVSKKIIDLLNTQKSS